MPCAIVHPRWRAPGCLLEDWKGWGLGISGHVLYPNSLKDHTGWPLSLHYHTQLRSLGTDLFRPCFACSRELGAEFHLANFTRGNMEKPNKILPVLSPSQAVGTLRARRPLLRACRLGKRRPTFTGDAVGGTPVEDHPLKESIVVHILLGPRGAQTAGAAALFFAQFCLIQNLAAAVLCLAEPAIPSCEETGIRR